MPAKQAWLPHTPIYPRDATSMRIVSILVAAAAAVTAQSPLSTTFAGGNGQSGNMFEVRALNPAGVTVTAFEVNSQSTSTGDFEVYTLAGSYAGNENNPAAWTLVGAATGIQCNGAGVPTPLPICVNAYIAQGTVQSFYVTHADTNIVAYTNGTVQGAVFAANADLEFYEGSGHSYPFVNNFAPRVWNGNIFYNVGNTQGTPCSFADASPYGSGCGGSGFASLYEVIPSAAMDLAGSKISGTNTGAGYLVQVTPGAGNITQGPTAQAMPLGDDDFLDTAFLPIPGTLGICVGSNGNIARGGVNTAGYSPDVNAFLTQPFEGLYAWTDLHSSTGGGAGEVYYEEIGTEAVVTYMDVSGWGTNQPNTFQFRWETSTGDWSIEFDALLNVSNPEDWLVGYSPGGNSLDPGVTDLSTLTAGNALATEALDRAPLELSSNRPILGTSWVITTQYVEPVSPLAFTLFGAAAATPVPLAAIGLQAPGCDILLAGLVADAAAPVTSGAANLVVPVANNPVLSGFQMSAQSIALSTSNAAFGVIGVVSSNGITATIGN